MSNNYYLPGTNIINTNNTNILNSDISNIPTSEITNVSIPDLYDLGGTLFPRDIKILLTEIVAHDNPDVISSSYCFLGSGTFDIKQTFETLQSASHLPILNYPAFSADIGIGYTVNHYNLPVITKMLPYTSPYHAFIGDDDKGYNITTTFNELPNVIAMSLITGNTVPIISAPAFIGVENQGFHNKTIYPTITFEDILNAESYKYYYAFEGTGTYYSKFLIDITDKEIETVDIRYDYSNTLQVYMNTNILNNKINVTKNKNNVVINSSYNSDTNSFDTNLINITSNEVFYDISSNHIKHLGAFDNFYTNFIEFVNNFFGVGGLNNNLFSSISKPSHDLSNNTVNFNKAYISTLLSTLSGTVKITDIASMINFCIMSNPFNNRPSGTKNRDGFLEGDKFFVKNGITITFNLDILNTMPKNDTSFNSLIDISGNQSIPQSIYNYDISYNNPFNITKSITTDLLIILKDNI